MTRRKLAPEEDLPATSVRVVFPGNEVRRIKMLAAKLNLTQSSFVREAVSDFLKKHTKASTTAKQ